MIWFRPGQAQDFRPDAIQEEIGNVGDTWTSSSDSLPCSILSAVPTRWWMPVTTNLQYISNIIKNPVIRNVRKNMHLV
jgi:hypothetical protein